MKKSLSSEAADRLRDYALSETTQGRIICATDYPFSPEDFPQGEQREIARGISKLQEIGFFHPSQGEKVKDPPANLPYHELSKPHDQPSRSEEH